MFSGVPFQIGYQQIKNQKTKNSMKSHMTPNSRDNAIQGIKKVVVEGAFTEGDLWRLNQLFPQAEESEGTLSVTLEKEETLLFKLANEYRVTVHTDCNQEKFKDKSLSIENVTIKNS
jgi:hypothetical protein